MFKHGFPPEWSTFKKLIWLVGAGIAGAASGIWKTVTGALIHITDALASPMQKCEVTLKPIQDLHGQDAPYPAGGGKNKCAPYSDTVFWTDDGYLNAQGGITANSGYKTSGYISVIPLAGYCFSTSTSGKWLGAYQYDAEKNPITSSGLAQNSTGEVTFTTSAQAAFVRIYSQEGADELQFEKGSKTSYSPYSNICPITGWTGCEVWVKDEYDTSLPATLSVTFPDTVGTVYGGTVDLVTGELVVKWAEADLGDFVWSKYEDTFDTLIKTSLPAAKKPSSGIVAAEILCTMYKTYASASVGETVFNAVGLNISGILYVSDTTQSISDIPAYTEHLRGVKLVYALKNPITCTLTPQEISTLKGENNVWSNGDSVEITYKAQA